jgi:hypothetical protein
MPSFDEVWTSVAPVWAALNGSETADDGAATVFSIPTSDVDQAPSLPDGGDVVEAPLGPFDVVEVTLFGRPAAKGRIAFGDGLAVVGRFEFEAGFTPDDFGPALLSALAEEAFLEGAETIYTVVEGESLPPFLGHGWSEAGRLRQG